MTNKIFFFLFKFDSKLAELEEELKVVGNNMKMLEISEQEALSREESYDEQIRAMSGTLKDVSDLYFKFMY